MHGPWVDDTEAEIDQHRKTRVTVIVLDRDDRAVHKAQVRFRQQRHDFVLGLTVSNHRLPPEGSADAPVYRCFNAVALDRHTGWARPRSTDPNDEREALKLWLDAIDPVTTSYGGVISADPARNSDKLTLLNATDLHDAVLARVDMAVGYEPTPGRLDLYTDLIYQDLIERKLGNGMIHRVFERARARNPEAKLALRVRDGVSLQHGRELHKAIQRFEIQQVPFDGVTIEQRFRGQVQPIPINRMLNEYVAKLPVPVTLAGLEVGGPSAVAAGLNLETVLRLAFAQPNIEGIYLSGLYQDELIEEHAALLDKDGQPTPAGEALDAMFNTHWRTDLMETTDERGNAQARVFTGWYRIEAVLPDGRVIQAEAYVPKSDRTKLIVLQATSAEAKGD